MFAPHCHCWISGGHSLRLGITGITNIIFGAWRINNRMVSQPFRWAESCCEKLAIWQTFWLGVFPPKKVMGESQWFKSCGVPVGKTFRDVPFPSCHSWKSLLGYIFVALAAVGLFEPSGTCSLPSFVKRGMWLRWRKQTSFRVDDNMNIIHFAVVPNLSNEKQNAWKGNELQ